MKPKITYKSELPSVEAFITLRESIGWTNPCLEVALNSLQNSLYSVIALDKDKLIGMGRIVGDGHMYFYIQDVVIAEGYQGMGIGKGIMERIEEYLAISAPKGATIGLLVAKGKETFYEYLGYKPRNGEKLGLGMCKFK